MASKFFKITNKVAYRRAGAKDLIELLPVPGSNPLYIQKEFLEALVWAIVSGEFIHISGPTGTAKSSLIEALTRVPENFNLACRALRLKQKPLYLYPIEMATFETPGELYQRRSLSGGSTFDENSIVVNALLDADKRRDTHYTLIWLREMGRVHSASVQGGLLNLMYKGEIELPNGNEIDGRGICWIADSNYQAESDSVHTLVTLDDALKRRFSVNLTLDYLPAALEIQVMTELAKRSGFYNIDPKTITMLIYLGNAIRAEKMNGELTSIAPPTIDGYFTFLKMHNVLNHFSLQEIASSTILGNASKDDEKQASQLFSQFFGMHMAEEEEDISMISNAF